LGRHHGRAQIPHPGTAVADGRVLVLVGEDGDHVGPVQRLVAIAIGIVDQAHRARVGGGLIHAGHGTLPVMPAPLIWHSTELSAWEAAVPSGSYTRATRDRDLAQEGFIHASWPEQVSKVAKRIYPDRPADLVILEIDVGRVEAAGIAVDIEADVDGKGRGYPHTKGPLPVSAVLRLRRTKPTGRQLVVVACPRRTSTRSGCAAYHRVWPDHVARRSISTST